MGILLIIWHLAQKKSFHKDDVFHSTSSLTPKSNRQVSEGENWKQLEDHSPDGEPRFEIFKILCKFSE